MPEIQPSNQRFHPPAWLLQDAVRRGKTPDLRCYGGGKTEVTMSLAMRGVYAVLWEDGRLTPTGEMWEEVTGEKLSDAIERRTGTRLPERPAPAPKPRARARGKAGVKPTIAKPS